MFPFDDVIMLSGRPNRRSVDYKVQQAPSFFLAMISNKFLNILKMDDETRFRKLPWHFECKTSMIFNDPEVTEFSRWYIMYQESIRTGISSQLIPGTEYVLIGNQIRQNSWNFQ